MKLGVVHQTRVHQARIQRLHPFYRKTTKQFHRDQLQITEAIGDRLMQLVMAKFRCVLCDKDSTVSEANRIETKQLFQKLRQLHPEHWYCKQSSLVDHSKCRTLDDVCFALYCLRFWRSRLGQATPGLSCLLTQSLSDCSYLLFKIYLSQYCDVCSDISTLLWQLDKPSAADELLSRLQLIHLCHSPAEGSFKEICDRVQALDLDVFIACLQKISTLKLSDDEGHPYRTIADKTHKLFSRLTINDFEIDSNLLVNDISKINVGSLEWDLKR